MTGHAKWAATALLALTTVGCADGSTGMMTTSALGPGSETVAKADPTCATLTARIDALRKEGVVASVEKASASKAKTVSVNRETLAKVAELDRANAEFQAKCALPVTASAAQPAAAKTAAAAATATPAAAKKQ